MQIALPKFPPQKSETQQAGSHTHIIKSESHRPTDRPSFHPARGALVLWAIPPLTDVRNERTHTHTQARTRPHTRAYSISDTAAPVSPGQHQRFARVHTIYSAREWCEHHFESARTKNPTRPSPSLPSTFPLQSFAVHASARAQVCVRVCVCVFMFGLHGMRPAIKRTRYHTRTSGAIVVVGSAWVRSGCGTEPGCLAFVRCYGNVSMYVRKFRT